MDKSFKEFINEEELHEGNKYIDSSSERSIVEEAKKLAKQEAKDMKRTVSIAFDASENKGAVYKMMDDLYEGPKADSLNGKDESNLLKDAKKIFVKAFSDEFAKNI